MNIFQRLFSNPAKTETFYSHLVSFDSISGEIEKKHLSRDQKSHLKSLAQSAIHHSVLDTVLTDLALDDKKDFLKLLHQNDHDSLRKIIQGKGLEAKIQDAFKKIEKEIILDLI